MNMKKERLEFLRISLSVITKNLKNLRLGSMVFLYAMVNMQWHLVIQSAI